MLNSKSDYRFVPQAVMRKITVEGKVLPLREQKRVFRGEDEAFLEEAAIEKEFPKQKKDFLADYTGQTDFLKVIQRIAGNWRYSPGWEPGEGGDAVGNGKDGMGSSIVQRALDRQEVSGEHDIPWDNPFGNSVGSEGIASRLVRGRYTTVMGRGFILPWRKDLPFPAEPVERGGWFEEDTERSIAESDIENDADDLRDSKDSAASDKYNAAMASAQSTYDSESARVWNLRYGESGIEAQYTQKKQADASAIETLEAQRDAANSAAEATRDAKIAEIEADDKGNKEDRIRQAKDECEAAKDSSNYYCARESRELTAATEVWYKGQVAAWNTAYDKVYSDYAKARYDAEITRYKEEYAAKKEYYDTVSSQCLYLIGYEGRENLTGVDESIQALAFQSHMLDDFRSFVAARNYLPFLWTMLESLYADSDMMRFKAYDAPGTVRLPYSASFRQVIPFGTRDTTDYTDYAAYHPTLGGLGYSAVSATMLGKTGHTSASSVYYELPYTIIEGGSKVCVRIGNRYTAGKIKSVKAIYKVHEREWKDEKVSASQTDTYRGNKWQWRTVNLTKKGAVSKTECEAIDAIHDRYFGIIRQMYDDWMAVPGHSWIDHEFQEAVVAKRDEEDAEVDAIINAKTAAITAKRKEYTDAWDEADDTFSDEYNAALAKEDYTERLEAVQAAYDNRGESRSAIVSDFVSEDIWTVDTEAREIWEADVPAIARQMSGGTVWDYDCDFAGCVYMLVEYDFGAITGADLSEYDNGVEARTSAFWGEFLPDEEDESENPQG